MKDAFFGNFGEMGERFAKKELENISHVKNYFIDDIFLSSKKVFQNMLKIIQVPESFKDIFLWAELKRVKSIENEQERCEALYNIFEDLILAKDIDTAIKVVNDIPQELYRDNGLSHIVNALASDFITDIREFEKACEVAHLISNQDIRNEILTSIALNLANAGFHTEALALVDEHLQGVLPDNERYAYDALRFANGGNLDEANAIIQNCSGQYQYLASEWFAVSLAFAGEYVRALESSNNLEDGLNGDMAWAFLALQYAVEGKMASARNNAQRISSARWKNFALEWISDIEQD